MTIEQANQYFAALPEGFAPAEELRAALPAAAQQVAYVGVAGTAGKTAAAALTAAVLQAAGTAQTASRWNRGSASTASRWQMPCSAPQRKR